MGLRWSYNASASASLPDSIRAADASDRMGSGLDDRRGGREVIIV